MQSYEKVTQEIMLGEQQELLDSEYMSNRVTVGTVKQQKRPES